MKNGINNMFRVVAVLTVLGLGGFGAVGCEYHREGKVAETAPKSDVSVPTQSQGGETDNAEIKALEERIGQLQTELTGLHDGDTPAKLMALNAAIAQLREEIARLNDPRAGEPSPHPTPAPVGGGTTPPATVTPLPAGGGTNPSPVPAHRTVLRPDVPTIANRVGPLPSIGNRLVPRVPNATTPIAEAGATSLFKTINDYDDLGQTLGNPSGAAQNTDQVCSPGQVITQLKAVFVQDFIMASLEFGCQEQASLGQDNPVRVLHPVGSTAGSDKTVVNAPKGYAFGGMEVNLCESGVVCGLRPYAYKVTASGLRTDLRWVGPKLGRYFDPDGSWKDLGCFSSENPKLMTGLVSRFQNYIHTLQAKCKEVTVATPPSETVPLKLEAPEVVNGTPWGVDPSHSFNTLGAGGALTALKCRNGEAITAANARADDLGGDYIVKTIAFLCKPPTSPDLIPATTDTNRQYLGRSGDNLYGKSCPPGHVATGIYGRAWGYLYGFSLYCSLYDPSARGDENDPVLVSNPISDETYGPDLEKRFFSSSHTDYMTSFGGQSFEILCPKDSVMTGVNVWNGEFIDGIQSIECSKRSVGR